MQQIRNATTRPLRLHLGRGKVLHLGPGTEGNVADDALERPAIRGLIEAGDVEVVGGSGGAVRAAESDAGTPRVAKHGHHPPTVVMPSGNR